MSKEHVNSKFNSEINLDATAALWVENDLVANIEIPQLGKIDLWWVDGVLDSEQEQILFSRLSKPEQDAARCFRVDAARQRYIASRIVLSNILSRYLGCAPQEVKYIYQEHGKPVVDAKIFAAKNNSSMPPLVFNISHSGNVILCAVAAEGMLGVDVECSLRDIELAQLSKRFFSEEEALQIESVKEDKVLQREAFFRFWTLKESFVKAIGLGLSYSLQDFALKIDLSKNNPQALAKLLRVTVALWQDLPWHLFSFYGPTRFAQGAGNAAYIAAISYEGFINDIVCRHVPLPLFI